MPLLEETGQIRCVREREKGKGRERLIERRVTEIEKTHIFLCFKHSTPWKLALITSGGLWTFWKHE